jgi:hypothetical protein
MVKVVKRVDATGTLGFLKILVANNQFHYSILCVSLVKITDNICGS